MSDELTKRISKCHEMIASMCKELRPPKMQIPARHNEYNEDIFIGDTLDMCQQELAELKAQNAVLREAFEELDSITIKGSPEDRIIKQALSTTPSEALEKQRKKDEVFKMLLSVCETGVKIAREEGIVFRQAENALAAAKELEGV